MLILHVWSLKSFAAEQEQERIFSWAHSSQLWTSKASTDNIYLLKGVEKRIYCYDCSLALILYSSTVKLFIFPLKKQTFTKFFSWNLLAFFPLQLYYILVSFMRIFRALLSPFSSLKRQEHFPKKYALINLHRNYSNLLMGGLNKNMSWFLFTCILLLGNSWAGPRSCISTSHVPNSAGTESLCCVIIPKSTERHISLYRT